ncbi:MAG: DUF1559 domain-containing protein [Planctomycetota bacterium]|nr:DUF1559 domain-containing protein [Planctomycetota bacterium]MDA1179383.1 DUF1559 domain-containing protein [Planctomycetota bacterium]
MIVAIFAIGTATIGCAYDVYWLSTGTDPLLTYYGVSGPGNKLKQITLAALNHESAKQRFPAGCVVDGTGQLLHGWMVQLLPYLEQADLYPKIDLRQAWNSEANSPHFRQSIYEFINPKYGGELVANGYAATNFSSNVHVIGGERSMKYGDITDGTSKTLLFGEAGGDFQEWGSPTNWRDPIQGLNRFPSGFGSPQHDRSTCFAFADNSIRYLSETIDPQVLRALATPNGGEQLSESEYGELLP